MDHLEMTEKLREKADVSFEEAKAALENNDWDLLKAIIDLENQGKIRKDTKEEATMESTQSTQSTQSIQSTQRARPATEAFEKAGDVVENLVNKGNRSFLEVRRDGRLLFKVPMTIAVIIAILCFWIVFPGLLIGFLFGWRYSFTSEAAQAEASGADAGHTA